MDPRSFDLRELEKKARLAKSIAEQTGQLDPRELEKKARIAKDAASIDPREVEEQAHLAKDFARSDFLKAIRSFAESPVAKHPSLNVNAVQKQILDHIDVWNNLDIDAWQSPAFDSASIRQLIQPLQTTNVPDLKLIEQSALAAKDYRSAFEQKLGSTALHDAGSIARQNLSALRSGYSDLLSSRGLDALLSQAQQLFSPKVVNDLLSRANVNDLREQIRRSTSDEVTSEHYESTTDIVTMETLSEYQLGWLPLLTEDQLIILLKMLMYSLLTYAALYGILLSLSDGTIDEEDVTTLLGGIASGVGVIIWYLEKRKRERSESAD